MIILILINFIVRGYHGIKDVITMTEQEFNDKASFELLGEDNTMIEDFCLYWTESSGKKMRFQLEKVFDLKRRFRTWKRNAEVRYKKPVKTNPIEGTLSAYEIVKNKIDQGLI